MSSILTEDNSQRLITITVYQLAGKIVPQSTRILGENELMGEISERHELMSLVKVNPSIRDCVLAYRITNEEVPIAISNNSKAECYYQIDEPVSILSGAKVLIGRTSIKIKEKASLWYMKLTNHKFSHPITTKLRIHTCKRYHFGRIPKDGYEANVEVLADLEVSKSHCEMWYGDGEWRIRDLDSSNGTYVRLRKGKEIGIKWEQVLRIGIDFYTYFTVEEV
eukprot:TRINITY_DN10657_c0_g1_i7.p1 TRINITY_DN10657_c0_g1~~TRINITY_DN10657_c0_g1_i7.p1  ORF type:complete len:222 (+),score=40.74 TRINITY_DN10657_c0_g1_i7:110-775(+)